MIHGIFNINRRPVKTGDSGSVLPPIVWKDWVNYYGPRYTTSYHGIQDLVVVGDKLITSGGTGNATVGNLWYTTDLLTWTEVEPNLIATGAADNGNSPIAFSGSTLMMQNTARQILYCNAANIDTGWQYFEDVAGTARPTVNFDRIQGSNVGYWVGFSRLSDGVHVSANLGGSWSVISAINWRVQGIDVMANDEFIIVGENNKIATSANGSTWTDRSIPSASNGGIDATIHFSDVVVHPADGHVYALAKAYNNGDINDAGGLGIGIWRSTDNGVSWEQAAWLDPAPFTGLEFNPTGQITAGDQPGHLLALSSAGEPIMTRDGFAEYFVKYYTDNQDLPPQTGGHDKNVTFMRINGEPYWYVEGAATGTTYKAVYILNNEGPFGKIP